MKKLLKTALSLLMTGTLLISPILNEKASASAQSNKAEYYVNQAKYWAGALKWQISVEYTKDVKYPDMKVFNNTKDFISKAKNEIKRLSGSEKTKLEKKLLDNAEIHYVRAVGYIDAITSGKRLENQTNEFNKSFKANPTSDATELAYHELSIKIKHTSKQLYKVYGKSTREAILKEYKTPAESAKKASINTISTKIAIDAYRNAWRFDKENIEKLINQEEDINIKQKLQRRLDYGEEKEEILLQNDSVYKREFEKLGFIFSSDTTALFSKNGIEIGLVKRDGFWQLATKNWGQVYEDLFYNSISVIWGRDKAWSNLKYIDNALSYQGSSFSSPNIKAFVEGDKLVVYIYLPNPNM
jgi:hypothetical protein